MLSKHFESRGIKPGTSLDFFQNVGVRFIDKGCCFILVVQKQMGNAHGTFKISEY